MKKTELQSIIREEVKSLLNEGRGKSPRDQLISTLTKMLKGNIPQDNDAIDFCESLVDLHGGDDNFYKKAHPDIKRVWNIVNQLADPMGPEIFYELLPIKMSLGMVIKKAITAMKGRIDRGDN